MSESNAEEDQHTVVGYNDADDYEALCDLAGDGTTAQLSDEEFVAKFVLAEQICRFLMFL